MKLRSTRRFIICTVIACMTFMNASIVGASSPSDVISNFSADVTNQQFYHRPNTPGDITQTDHDWSATWFTNDILAVNNPLPNNGNYNYITINLKPTVSGNYTIKIDQATGLLTNNKPDTQIWLYQDSFDPLHPLTNVLAVNEDIDYFGPSGNESDGNWLSQISDAPLEAGRTYVFVITTYSAGVTGHVDFHIAGPGSVTASGSTLDPVPPSVSADDDANIIVGLDTTMEFMVDNSGSYTRYDGTNAPDLSGNHVVQVRVAADSTAGTPAGPSATLNFTANPQLTNAEVPSIDTEPADQTVNVGEQASLSVVASGGVALSYQWYSNTTNSTAGGTPIASATNATFEAPTAAAGTTYYYVVVTNTDSAATGTKTATATSAVAKVTVNELTHAAVPSIDTEPADQTVNVGEQASLNVVASGGVALSYQWYSNTTNSAAGGTPIASATSATFEAPTAAAGTTYYYVVVTNTDSAATGNKTATATSAVAKVTVNELTYTIAPIANQSGTRLTEGYTAGAQDTKTIMITNSGTGTLNNVAVSLSGPQADSFVLTQPLTLPISDNQSTTFTIKAADGLQAGTYTATVTVSADGMTPVTFTFTQVIDLPAAPQTPVNLAALSGNGQVQLSWEASAGADHYDVYAGIAPGQYGSSPIATVTDTVYTAAGLTNGTTYYFTVQAVNRGGRSEASNEASAKPVAVPAAPVNVQAAAGDGQATVTFTAPADNGGSPITGYEVTALYGEGQTTIVTGTASPITVTGLTNGQTYTFTVKAISAVGSSLPSAASNAATPYRPSAGGGTVVTNNAGSNVNVWVNGKAESAGTATTSTRNSQKVTTIAVDQQKLNDKLAAEGQHAVVTIALNSASDIVVGELNGQMVRSLEDKQAVLEIRTERATYSLPAEQINMSSISGQLGQSVPLQDIKVRVEIAEPTADQVTFVRNAAEDGSLTLVAPPVEFTVTAVYGDKTIAISKFDAYVERRIAIPDGVDPSKITTGVVIDPDGTVRHVPTKVVVVDGQHYAVLNSLTNSTYSVVWHPIEFSDVTNHWAKNEINDMGSRMVIDGTGNGLFDPNRSITRAEFVAIIVRGLGLKPDNGASMFSDVQQSDWYSSVINTAVSYQLINGFEDGSFRPNDKITREQAMAIIAKAMAITGLDAKLSGQSSDEALRPYADASQVSGWAKDGTASSVQSGIVSGRTASQLAPKQFITRAEVAAIIERLLQKSDLI